ncbi:hypothetical protein ABIA41_002666 [Bradyrhizobium sp. USDA 313]
MTDEDLELLLFPAPRPASQSPQRPVPDWSYIDKELRRRNVTRRLLWEEYRAVNPDGFGYTCYVAAKFILCMELYYGERERWEHCSRNIIRRLGSEPFVQWRLAMDQTIYSIPLTVPHRDDAPFSDER